MSVDESESGVKRAPSVDTDLVENIISGGIEYVFVTKWDGREWPRQQAVLAGSEKAHAVYNDDYSTIWQVTP